MALKKREKMLVGVMLVCVAVATVAYVTLPCWDSLSANQQKLTDTKASVQSLTTQKGSLQSELESLKTANNLPPGIDIPRITSKTKEIVIKGILDDVVSNAADSGNKLISLKPYDAPPIIPPPPPPEPNKNNAPAMPGMGTQTQEAPPPPPPLVSVGYELAVRGTYNTIQAFLKRMDNPNQLIEMHGIELENESGPVRVSEGGAPDENAVTDPMYPIKLKAKLRLILLNGD